MDTLFATATATLAVAAGTERERAPMAHAQKDQGGGVVREVARVAFVQIAARFSDDVPPTVLLEQRLQPRYSAMRAWPSDAQVALLVVGWVLGPGFRNPDFEPLLNVDLPDFAAAAKLLSCPRHPALVTVAGIAREMFENGAFVLERNLDPALLHWPMKLPHVAA